MQDIEKQITETLNDHGVRDSEGRITAELLSLFTTYGEEIKKEAEANNEALLAVKEHRKRAEATINRIQMFPCPCGVTSVHFHGIENEKRIQAEKEIRERERERIINLIRHKGERQGYNTYRINVNDLQEKKEA